MAEHRFGNKITRQGYVCPDCGCIKDGFDPEYGGWVRSRWCHNYRGHRARGGGRVRMRPTALLRYVNADTTAPQDKHKPEETR